MDTPRSNGWLPRGFCVHPPSTAPAWGHRWEPPIVLSAAAVFWRACRRWWSAYMGARGVDVRAHASGMVAGAA